VRELVADNRKKYKRKVAGLAKKYKCQTSIEPPQVVAVAPGLV
jgi:hypothetical protein